uniref:Capsid protein n=1 Tax=Ara ararauna Chaphamaparvovirus TaxID=2794484 RepID=A0A8A4XCP3_9VIRU|nr:MAG: capsid protein [Ara ararauna Chaphamaparvovirus]
MFLPNRIGKPISVICIIGMAEDFSVSNVYNVYLGNQPYTYPTDNKADVANTDKVNTGWHVIPNMLWRHFITPGQWASLIIGYEAYHVEKISCTLFNMVPMTTQLAIQGNTLFTAFNNTIYAMGYTDELYETSWENWVDTDIINNYGVNLAWKEGLNYNVGQTTTRINQWPVYLWRYSNSRTSSQQTWANESSRPGSGDGCWPAGTSGTNWPSGCFWDPLNMPDKIQELRPGKNAMTFTWNCHPTDENIWFNLDGLASWYPWTPTGPYTLNRPETIKLSSTCDPDQMATKYQHSPTVNDYTIPNLAMQPLVPCSWWWQEISKSIIGDHNPIKQPDMRFPGTEAEQYKYPPHQWFTKLIPIFNDSGTHIDVTALVSCKVSLHLKVKKRRSAYYAPTWGPFPWRNVYSAQTQYQVFQPAMVRYRTGGMRRTWQNRAQEYGQNYTTTGHPREDPYLATTNIVSSGTGIACTSITTTTAVPRDVHAKGNDLQITFSTGTTPTPIAPKRRANRVQTVETDLAIKDLTFFPHLTDSQL